MSLGKPGHHAAIWGRTGAGKTHFALAMLQHRERLVVFDPMHEFGGRKVSSRADLRAELLAGWNKGFRLSYVPAPDAYWPAELHQVATACRAAMVPFQAGQESRPLTLAADELTGAYPNRAAEKGLDAFGDLCRRGRHYGIQLVGISQGVAEVSTVFRRACIANFYFPVADATDLDTVAGKIGREHRDTLRDLPEFHYIAHQAGKATVCPPL